MPWELEFADGLHDLLHHDRGEAHGGLVEHEELGLGHQGAAHGEHLLFAAGEGAGGLFAAFAEDGEEVVGALDVLLDACRVLAEEGAELEVFGDGQAGEDAAAFGGVGEAAWRRSCGRGRR